MTEEISKEEWEVREAEEKLEFRKWFNHYKEQDMDDYEASLRATQHIVLHPMNQKKLTKEVIEKLKEHNEWRKTLTPLERFENTKPFNWGFDLADLWSE